MANLNKVMLIGNCTRDVEIKYTPKGTAVANFSIACNHKYKTSDGEPREEVTFVDIDAWGRQAEIAGEYLKKGRPVFVEGRLKMETWDDKATGQKRSKMKVVLDNLQLLGSKQANDDADTEEPPTRPRTPPPTRPTPPRDPDLDVSDDDIPF